MKMNLINVLQTILKLQIILLLVSILFACSSLDETKMDSLQLNESGYFESRGVNVFVYNNPKGGVFGDSKDLGIEIIHHEVRTASNGDVRLSPTPAQWDPLPVFVEKRVDKQNNRIITYLKYPKYNFNYTMTTEVMEGGLQITIDLEKPLPMELENRAGFNFEFLPSAYFEKGYLIDEKNGVFPKYPGGSMEFDNSGEVQPKAIDTGKRIVLAPEDPSKSISIVSDGTDLALYDGRNVAQNGWFVVRSLIPSGKTGKVIQWLLTVNSIPDWKRPPMIAYSQVGYHPDQKKVAVIEFDKNDLQIPSAKLFRVQDSGKLQESYGGKTSTWGKYLRYNYCSFDFTKVTEPGLYVIEYGKSRTQPFRIAKDVYAKAWHPSLDIYVPVQMDHMLVNEAYRIWHGASHLDDARQAPVNHEHFDLYKQGPTTDTKYKPGETIPGLNVGGWYDAGDFDIRTETQYKMVQCFVKSWEAFHLIRDETTIDQKNRYVDIHVPDGKPDILQQIEHGVIGLIAQQKAFGRAINGIIAPELTQYTHLGDAGSKTDNRFFNSKLKPGETDGYRSGLPDDRWAFTSRSTPVNYGSAAGLAAASRALRGYNDVLADECLTIAKNVWKEEHSHSPYLFTVFNTTGGTLEREEFSAAFQLYLTTKEKQYADKLIEFWPIVEKQFGPYAASAVVVYPMIDKSYTNKLKELVVTYENQLDKIKKQNPFGVSISRGGWAGNGGVIGASITNYFLHKAFPEIVDSESVFAGLNYIFGCHPASNFSMVAGVGTISKRMTYGNNRADFSFIAGGIVPGIMIIEPDFPENKDDWPFLWGENEICTATAPDYIFTVNAVNELLNHE